MSSGFISEVELAEQRKRREEEWKKIRTEDDPLEPPEPEPYDPRSLYERLQERKNQRDIEYEEAHKFKNMIKGLDDDEVEFLDLVDRTKLEEERRKHLEEEKEMQELREAVALQKEEAFNKKLMQELRGPQNSAKTSSQSSRSQRLKMLSGVVIKKSGKTNSDQQCKNQRVENKRKLSDVEDDNGKVDENGKSQSEATNENSLTAGDDALKSTRSQIDDGSNKNMKCIGILPGLGSYGNSSDSDCSSDTDEEPDSKKVKYDILGRKIDPIDLCKDKDKS